MGDILDVIAIWPIFPLLQEWEESVAFQKPDWTAFKVGNPGEKHCNELATVRHVSHVETALSIIEADEMRPTLVFDESILNDKRILVSWFSPNFWNPGFRYGTVCFEFDFVDLLSIVSRSYWVEAVAYNTPACRILLTDQNHDAFLNRYEPRDHDGPWWYDEESDKHYFNGAYCLEFMLEGPVPAKCISALSFVKHHPQYCSVHRLVPDECPELGMTEWEGGARFLARAIHGDVSLSRYQNYFLEDNGCANWRLRGVVTQLWRDVADGVEFNGEFVVDTDLGLLVSRAMLGEYAWARLDEATAFVRMLRDEESFFHCVAYWCAHILDAPDWKVLMEGLEV